MQIEVGEEGSSHRLSVGRKKGQSQSKSVN